MEPVSLQFSLRRLLGATVWFAVAAALAANYSRWHRGDVSSAGLTLLTSIVSAGAGFGQLFGRPYVGVALTLLALWLIVIVAAVLYSFLRASGLLPVP